MKATFILIH